MTWVDGDAETALELAWQAREMALRTGDRRTAVNSLVTIGSIQLPRNPVLGRELLEQAMAEGREAGYSEQVARALNNLGAPDPTRCSPTSTSRRRSSTASRRARTSGASTSSRSRRETLSTAGGGPRPPTSRSVSFLTRGSPHGRITRPTSCSRSYGPGVATRARTLPSTRQPAVGVPADDLGAHLDLAAARAEVAWLEQRTDGVEAATERALASARGRGVADGTARTSFWRLLAGLPVDPELDTSPYALAVAGRWEDAAAEWERSAYPYEAALALIETNDEESLRRALTTLQELGALPAAQLATRRLRALGAKGVTRGPRRATRANAAGLTPRESEVLELLAAGRRNAGDRASSSTFRAEPSTITCRHSCASWDAGSRVEAVASAQRLGLL